MRAESLARLLQLHSQPAVRLVVVIAWLLVSALSTVAQTATPPLGAAAAQPADLANDVIHLTNQQRAANGLLPLKRVAELDAAASIHAADMANNDFFSHTGSDGSRVGDRIAAAGYFNWATAGENIAAGYPTADAVVAAWMASPAHRAIILHPDMREIGIGYLFQTDDQPNVLLPGGAMGGPYYHYWVQNFGARYDVYPILINAEAPTTDSRSVQLTIYGSEWASDMLIANNPAFVGANWQPFQSSLAWTLDAGTGLRSVHLRLRDAYGNTLDDVHDDIWLNGDEPPTATPTATAKPPTATPTATVEPPTATPTATVEPPTATPTATPVPPTPTPTPEMVYLHGTAFYDANQNGLHDAYEVFGLPGAFVILKNQAGEVLDMTTADADGAYQFVMTDPRPGSYTIKTVPQSAVIPTSQNPSVVNLTPGQGSQTVDFGFVCDSGPTISDMAAMPLPETTIQIVWTVSGETGSEQYQVQRADTLRGPYVTVGVVPAQGDGAYSFTDTTAPAGIRSWYRLAATPSNRLAGPVDALLIGSAGFRVMTPLVLR